MTDGNSGDEEEPNIYESYGVDLDSCEAMSGKVPWRYPDKTRQQFIEEVFGVLTRLQPPSDASGHCVGVPFKQLEADLSHLWDDPQDIRVGISLMRQKGFVFYAGEKRIALVPESSTVADMETVYQ